MNETTIVKIMQCEKGKYPIIEKKIYLNPDEEVFEIREFLLDTIYRANKYKEKTEHYPDSIEDLKGWEEIN